MEPLVSVVITTYGGQDVIIRAINSVAKQTYKNIEIIVVDDNGLGSQDQIETEKLVKDTGYEITYIPHETNKNGSAARNTGIKYSKGIYVALLDDDDTFRPEKIQKQVDVMENKSDEYALCYTGMQIHFPNGKVIDQIYDDEGSIFELAILKKVRAQTSEFIFRRDKALKIGGFDEEFRRHQDWEFFERMCHQYKIAVVPEICIDRYILKRTAATSPQQYEENRLFYMKKMECYINGLESNKRKEFYHLHYRSICKEYIKQHKIIGTIKYIIKSGNPVNTLFEFYKSYKSSSLV